MSQYTHYVPQQQQQPRYVPPPQHPQRSQPLFRGQQQRKPLYNQQQPQQQPQQQYYQQPQQHYQQPQLQHPQTHPQQHQQIHPQAQLQQHHQQRPQSQYILPQQHLQYHQQQQQQQRQQQQQQQQPQIQASYSHPPYLQTVAVAPAPSPSIVTQRRPLPTPRPRPESMPPPPRPYSQHIPPSTISPSPSHPLPRPAEPALRRPLPSPSPSPAIVGMNAPAARSTRSLDLTTRTPSPVKRAFAPSPLSPSPSTPSSTSTLSLSSTSSSASASTPQQQPHPHIRALPTSPTLPPDLSQIRNTMGGQQRPGVAGLAAAFGGMNMRAGAAGSANTKWEHVRTRSSTLPAPNTNAMPPPAPSFGRELAPRSDSPDSFVDSVAGSATTDDADADEDGEDAARAPSPQYGIRDLPARGRSVLMRAGAAPDGDANQTPTRTPVVRRTDPSYATPRAHPETLTSLPRRDPQMQNGVHTQPSQPRRPSSGGPGPRMQQQPQGQGQAQSRGYEGLQQSLPQHQPRSHSRAFRLASSTLPSNSTSSASASSGDDDSAVEYRNASPGVVRRTPSPARSWELGIDLDDAPPPPQAMRRSPSPALLRRDAGAAVPMVRTPDAQAVRRARSPSPALPLRDAGAAVPMIRTPDAQAVRRARSPSPVPMIRTPDAPAAAVVVPRISFPGADDDDDDDGDDGDGEGNGAGPSIMVTVSAPQIRVPDGPVVRVDEGAGAGGQRVEGIANGVRGLPRLPAASANAHVLPSANANAHALPSANANGVPNANANGVQNGGAGVNVPIAPAVHGGPRARGGGLVCGGCQRGIVGRIVSAMGARWHPQCFRCSTCGELLEHVSSYEHEGKAYCHLDYHEMFAPRCYQCETPIIDERFITLDDPALGKRTYHEQHFFCAECGDPFLAPSSSGKTADAKGKGKAATGEISVTGDGEFDVSLDGDDEVGFTVYRGHPYCEACHVRLRMPKCRRCKKSIREGMQAVEALGGKWCWACFVCAGCDKPFENPSFFQREQKPYCEPCFSLIIRNEV